MLIWVRILNNLSMIIWFGPCLLCIFFSLLYAINDILTFQLLFLFSSFINLQPAFSYFSKFLLSPVQFSLIFRTVILFFTIFFNAQGNLWKFSVVRLLAKLNFISIFCISIKNHKTCIKLIKNSPNFKGKHSKLPQDWTSFHVFSLNTLSQTFRTSTGKQTEHFRDPIN